MGRGRRLAIALLAAISVLLACAPARATAPQPDLAAFFVSENGEDLMLVKGARPDPNRCVERVTDIPQIDQATLAKWSPDSTTLLFARIMTVPSSSSVTGSAEQLRLGTLDLETGKVTDLGWGGRPEWSGSGRFVSFYRDGYEIITQDGREIARLDVGMPEVRWLGDQLLYWSWNEIRVWEPGAHYPLSQVDPQYRPRYPADDAYFSADGTLFTLTRYRMDGSAERYVGETRTGQVTPLPTPGATYTEWSPFGGTLLVRSNERVELRGPNGWLRGAAIADFPGPVHGWSADGKTLLMGAVSATTPGGTAFDRFSMWDGDQVVATATLPNLIGARALSPNGRFFVGTDRTGLYSTQLALFRCGTRARGVGPEAFDAKAMLRWQAIESDPRHFIRPVAGFISQFRQGAHTGIDVAAPVGSLITADDWGTVTFVGWAPVGGRAVCVTRGPLESCFYHTSISYVRVGEKVVRGQPVAAVGMTGATTGPHVHWEVKQNGMIVDPIKQ